LIVYLVDKQEINFHYIKSGLNPSLKNVLKEFFRSYVTFYVTLIMNILHKLYIIGHYNNMLDGGHLHQYTIQTNLIKSI